jgi:hypothetical protein
VLDRQPKDVAQCEEHLRTDVWKVSVRTGVALYLGTVTSILAGVAVLLQVLVTT